MKRFLVLAIIVAFSSGLSFAQSWRGHARLEGTLKDPNGKPVAGATVKLTCVKYGGEFEVKSDAKGKWVAGGIRGGDWNIDITAQGFAPKQLADQISEIIPNKPIDIVLQPDPHAMAVAESTAQRQEALTVLSKGNSLYDEGKYAESLAEFQAILAKSPDLYIVNVNIANCYYKLNQPDKAIETLNAVLEKDPANTDVMTRLGNIYAEQGNLEKALEYFGKIDQSTIKDPTAFYNIGVLLYNKQKVPEALGYFQKAVAVDPNYADGYYQIGLCYVNQGDMAKAKEAFNKFLQLAPDSPNAPIVQSILKSM